MKIKKWGWNQVKTIVSLLGGAISSLLPTTLMWFIIGSFCDNLYILSRYNASPTTSLPRGIFKIMPNPYMWHISEKTWTIYRCYIPLLSLFPLCPHERHVSKFWWCPSCGILLKRHMTTYSCYVPRVLLLPTCNPRPLHATYCWKDLCPLTHRMHLSRTFLQRSPNGRHFTKFSREPSCHVSLSLSSISLSKNLSPLIDVLRHRCPSHNFAPPWVTFLNFVDNPSGTYRWKDMQIHTHVMYIPHTFYNKKHAVKLAPLPYLNFCTTWINNDYANVSHTKHEVTWRK